jgi:hypothetical protein
MFFFKKSLFLYLFLFTTLFFSISQLVEASNLHFNKAKADFSQPPLPVSKNWYVKSIDTQVVSKHWQNVPPASIREQVTLIKALGVNYVAIATPYDRALELQLWADEIHKQDLHVWFRSHWAEWEGDDGKPATMSSEEYLVKTKQFIIDNPTLFKEGDAFTIAVEPEQAGVGLGKKFKDWDAYRQFLLDEITYANQGFKEIGLTRKIHTNWLSVNGWIVENVFTPELVDKLQLITIDHYPEQSKTIGQLEDINQLAETESADLDRFYHKWRKPILLGEWGYHIYQEVDDKRQAEVIEHVLETIQNKPYIVGLNYWVHMGNPSRIINDEWGGNLSYREGAQTLKDIFAQEKSDSK